MKALLFDLDGTLSNNQEGIISSIQHALGQLSSRSYADEELLWCIGPPLHESFAQILETSEQEKVDEALGLFRERFGTIGILQNELYVGIDVMLGELAELGHPLFVATSKPRVYAKRIIDHFGLNDYFVNVYGSEFDGTRADKGDLIGYVLQSEGLDPQSTMMIGDRKHDMLGAKKQAVETVGVLWGFGDRAELDASGAAHLASSPQDLLTIVGRS